MHRCHLPVYDEKKCVFFALGRNAMYAACRMLDLKDGDEVLTPAFDCDGSLQPFKALELKLKFFRSDPHTFSADIDDIKRKITYGTKLLHIINHFGMPQDWRRFWRLGANPASLYWRIMHIRSSRRSMVGRSARSATCPYFHCGRTFLLLTAGCCASTTRPIPWRVSGVKRNGCILQNTGRRSVSQEKD
jgi:hypothetical protein